MKQKRTCWNCHNWVGGNAGKDIICSRLGVVSESDALNHCSSWEHPSIKCSECKKKIEVKTKEQESGEGWILCDDCVRKVKARDSIKLHKCKHDYGWVSDKPVHILVDEKNAIFFDFQRGKKAKIRAVCNKDCGEVRNIYITQKFGVKIGGSLVRGSYPFANRDKERLK